jgi:cytochrome c551/c552
MKKTIITFSLIFSLGLFLAACGGSGENNTNSNSSADTSTAQAETSAPANASADTSTSKYDPTRGEGKFHDVKLSSNLDGKMAEEGDKIYELKCSSCHKLTDERLVGPGWKGVTKRQTPAWIMNFVTNTDAMIDKDPKAQAMLEICMVRMPNQNLSDDQAREILEFMRKNDGVK